MDLHAELLDVLKPFHILTSIFCVRKYAIRNKRVTIIGPKQMGLTINANFFLIYLFCTTFETTAFKEFSLKLYYIVIYGQHLTTFIVISCHNMRMRKAYVALMKKLQEIYCFERMKTSSKYLKRTWRISCWVLIYLYIVVIAPKLVLDPYWNWARTVFLGLSIVIDLELLFIIFVVRLLATKFKVWSDTTCKLSTDTINYNNDDDASTENQISLEDIEDLPKESEERDIEEYRDEDCQEDNSDEAKKLFVVFNQLVDATDLMKSLFQFTIFYHAVALFMQVLVYIAVLIMWMKLAQYEYQLEKNVIISHSTGIIMWITKALILEAMLGCSMEGLYSATRASRSTACVLISRHDLSTTTTRYAKNTLRLSASRLHRFTAVGALAVDAALPLRLAALVGSYTVVLLQFALL